MLESVRTNSSVREMLCDLSLASFDAVDDDAFDGTDAAITDIAAIDEDWNDLDANNTVSPKCEPWLDQTPRACHQTERT